MTETVVAGDSHVVVVSLRKSGTHLIGEVMKALGYAPFGAVRVSGDVEFADPAQVRRLLEVAYGSEEAGRLLGGQDRTAPAAAFEAVVAALHKVWAIRLGAPTPLSLSGVPGVDAGLVGRLLCAPQAADFDLLPGRCCWFVHQLDLTAADPAFLNTWLDTGRPRIIFNYRSLPDILVSTINFLVRDARPDRPDPVGTFPDHRVYRDILRSLPDMDARLRLALTDPGFPGMETARRSLWLLRHPAVCKVSFEELIGPHGGGTGIAQQTAVARIADFLGSHTASARTIAEQIFNPNSFTFHQGRTGTWREYFGPHHEELLQRNYGDVACAYGALPTGDATERRVV
ncbi:hypothetical protein [Streptomyces coeruleorubidus]|uniref:hypothetical protein n=1 Tax=Streptomyces coeruleorubidus TaxID=116188 RepID=UPI0033E27BCF